MSVTHRKVIGVESLARWHHPTRGLLGPGAFIGVAESKGHTILDLAMSWLATKPFISSVIAGATSPMQVEANANAASWRLTPEEMAEVDAISKR